MFRGLSAFPLTPIKDGAVDETAFLHLLERLVAAGVDSICTLGSTGSYAYLTLAERQRIAQLAIEHGAGVPVIIGIGALSARDVIVLAGHAQDSGAAGVLLAPVSYQKLTDDEVFNLYEAATRSLSIPLCVYDNPGTTHFAFSDALHGRIAQLPQVASIKIPGVPLDPATAIDRIGRLRALIPSHVTIGVSGDRYGATGLNAGCEAWYSAIGGLFPKSALAICRAAQAGDAGEARRLSARLDPLWAMFTQHGSLRVIATAAELQGLVASPCLPLPVQALDGPARLELAGLLETLELAG